MAAVVRAGSRPLSSVARHPVAADLKQLITAPHPHATAPLCAGRRPGDLTEEEVLAADVAGALLDGGPLPGPLYTAVVEKLGQEAFDTMVFVTIHYLAISAILNVYDVPAGDPVVPVTHAA
ncbi:hypothetical protein SRB17_83990 [Streptomyces sp. RB17]|nr:hypothetical protein [Streptomyces sp. RB17]